MLQKNRGRKVIRIRGGQAASLPGICSYISLIHTYVCVHVCVDIGNIFHGSDSADMTEDNVGMASDPELATALVLLLSLPPLHTGRAREKEVSFSHL